MYWLTYVIILLLGIGIFSWLIHRQRARPYLQKLVIAALSLFLTLMLVELGFKLFFAQSDGFRYTLASQNWYERYWQENSLGYRDVEWTADMLVGKTKIMVVGDSFAAGSGIENPADRFADQLGQRLGDAYAIMLVASPGWDTIDEVKAITEHPYPPDALILSYFINDIEGVAYESGAKRPQIRVAPPFWLKSLVDNSHAANFLYWRLIRLAPQQWDTTYWEEWLLKIHTDPDIRWRHRQELIALAEGAAAQQIPLFVVVFPNLVAVEESAVMVQPVIDLFQERGASVLDVREILQPYDPTETVVNGVDSHPNELIHHEVAARLHDLWLQTVDE